MRQSGETYIQVYQIYDQTSYTIYQSTIMKGHALNYKVQTNNT